MLLLAGLFSYVLYQVRLHVLLVWYLSTYPTLAGPNYSQAHNGQTSFLTWYLSFTVISKDQHNGSSTHGIIEPRFRPCTCPSWQVAIGISKPTMLLHCDMIRPVFACLRLSLTIGYCVCASWQAAGSAQEIEAKQRLCQNVLRSVLGKLST